jgi:hypothetical protein
VWRLPGGDTSSITILNVLGILFWGGLAFFAYRMYMEHRTTLFGLEDRTRATLYGAVALGAITLLAPGDCGVRGASARSRGSRCSAPRPTGLVTVFRTTREY